MRHIRKAGAAGPPPTGAFSTITAAVWTAGFHWWRSGNKKRTQNVSEYMLVLAPCLVVLCICVVTHFLIVTCDYSILLMHWSLLLTMMVSARAPDHTEFCCRDVRWKWNLFPIPFRSCRLSSSSTLTHRHKVFPYPHSSVVRKKSEANNITAFCPARSSLITGQLFNIHRAAWCIVISLFHVKVHTLLIAV